MPTVGIYWVIYDMLQFSYGVSKRVYRRMTFSATCTFQDGHTDHVDNSLMHIFYTIK